MVLNNTPIYIGFHLRSTRQIQADKLLRKAKLSKALNYYERIFMCLTALCPGPVKDTTTKAII